MIVLFLLILFLCLWKIQIKNDNKEYMSLYNTTCINGIFILVVFFRHISQYADYTNIIDQPMTFINGHINQFLVVMFLFYSGYGIFECIKKKENYVQTIPRRRILKVWIQFMICVCIFGVLGIALGAQYSIKQVILSLLALDSLGNSNWYILAMLFMWIFTWIAFEVFGSEKILALVAITIMSIIFIVIMKDIKPTYYYNTVLCYVMGMWFSYFKNKIDKHIVENKVWAFLTILSGIIAFVFYKYRWDNLIYYELCAVTIAWFIVCITMRVSIRNNLLFWLGKNLFPLYILQRIPMIILRTYGLNQTHIYLYGILCGLGMIVFAVIYNLVSNGVKNIIKL